MHLKHFLLTRFNVRVKDWKTTKKGEQVLSEEWLSHRFNLFETYCFPSVLQQSNQAFDWFVFFDPQTPMEYQARIAQLQSTYKNFQPLYINDFSELLPVLKREIHSRLTTDITHVLTSRMDNDDSIHRDYIDQIQKISCKQSTALIDIVDGYNLSIEPEIKLGKIRSPLNPFSSLIEEATDPKTILSKSHTDWTTGTRIITVKNRRLWLQIIHEKNKVNTYRGIRVASFDRLATDFGLPQNLVNSFPRAGVVPVLFENLNTLIHLGIKNAKRIAHKLLKG